MDLTYGRSIGTAHNFGILTGFVFGAMDREKGGDAPFRYRLNGNRCVPVVGRYSARAYFEGFQRPFRMPYAAIRCVQLWYWTVLINGGFHGGCM